MPKLTAIYVVCVGVTILTFCGCAGLTAEEEFENGRVALGLKTRDGNEQARGYFHKALEIDGEYWQAAVALAKVDLAEKKYNDAVTKLLEYRRICNDPVYKKQFWELLFQTYRAAGNYQDSRDELISYRARYDSLLPFRDAKSAQLPLTPAESDFLSKFEEELILLMEGKPLPSRRSAEVTVQPFPLPEGGALATARLVSNALRRNIEGLPLPFPKQPHDSLLDPYNGNLSLSIYRPNRDKIVLHGRGETLLAAVMGMLKNMYVTLPSAEGLRFRLDFETKRINGEGIANIQKRFTAGIDGLAVKQGSKEGFVLPGDILETDLQSISALKDRLAGELEADPTSAFAWRRFQSEAYLVTGLGEKDSAIRLFRTHASEVDTSTDARKEAVINACDFLVRVQREDGSWPYRFNPFSGPLGGKRRYTMRDAEVTHFLFAAYGRYKNKSYLKAAELGLARLFNRIHERKEDGIISNYLLDRVKIGKTEEERASLGAAAVACLAFLHHTAVTDNSTHMQEARGFIAFVHKMQHDDGSFDMFYSPRGEKLIQKPMLYYPGAAALALARYGDLADDPDARAAAVKALEYYMPEYIRTGRFDQRMVLAAFELESEAEGPSLVKLAIKMATI